MWTLQDNALAKSTIGSLRTERINRHGLWRGVNQVEVATFEWVDSFDTQRLHESLKNQEPVVVRADPLRSQIPLAQAG